jgi:acetyltransferase-like isoleucine patch superfamily enzyme
VRRSCENARVPVVRTSVEDLRVRIFKQIRNAFFSSMESLIRNIAGGLGQRIRYLYYSRRFRKCGRRVKIDEGVIFQNPESIVVGNDVWFLPYSIITGRGREPIPNSRIVVSRAPNPSPDLDNSEDVLLSIGDQTSIGAYNILHGYGGLTIGCRVTTSARVSIYSFSHIPSDPSSPSTITYANSMVKDAPIACIVSPITLHDGVWLGLGVTVFGGELQQNCFVEANSVVTGNLAENSYARGQPAVRIRARFAINADPSP